MRGPAYMFVIEQEGGESKLPYYLDSYAIRAKAEQALSTYRLLKRGDKYRLIMVLEDFA